MYIISDASKHKTIFTLFLCTPYDSNFINICAVFPSGVDMNTEHPISFKDMPDLQLLKYIKFRNIAQQAIYASMSL